MTTLKRERKAKRRFARNTTNCALAHWVTRITPEYTTSPRNRLGSREALDQIAYASSPTLTRIPEPSATRNEVARVMEKRL